MSIGRKKGPAALTRRKQRRRAKRPHSGRGSRRRPHGKLQHIPQPRQPDANSAFDRVLRGITGRTDPQGRYEAPGKGARMSWSRRRARRKEWEANNEMQ